MIAALSGESFPALTESDWPLPDDLAVLSSALCTDLTQTATIDVGASGTALRFLTAYLCLKTQAEVKLKGTARLCQRPIAPLVDALRQMGAEIRYLEKDGFAPLLISPSSLFSGPVRLDASLSSQFVSALLLIAPYLSEGLDLHLMAAPPSAPYITMTVEQMRRSGAQVTVSADGRLYHIAAKPYRMGLAYMERDWSASAFFYALVAIRKDPHSIYHMHGLANNSIQGDKCAIEQFGLLGVYSREQAGGIEIHYNPAHHPSPMLEVNFSDHPDMLPAWVVAATLQGQSFVADGIATLRHKESNRISAVLKGLAQLGFTGFAEGSERLVYQASTPYERQEMPLIDCCDDHRIAMAFAMVAADRRFGKGISLDGIEAVNKSFPNFESVAVECGFHFEPAQFVEP